MIAQRDASVSDFEARARVMLDEPAYNYCAGGACTETTLRRNVEDFERWKLLPRILPQRGSPSLETQIAGISVRCPIGIAPVSLQRMVHEEGEIALARGAAKMGAPFVLSCFASYGIEDVVAQVPGGEKFHQVYPFSEPALTESIVARAVAAGCRAIIVTLDTPRQGIRYRDLRGALDRFGRYRPSLCDDPVFRDLLRKRPDVHETELINELFPNPRGGWHDIEEIVRQVRVPVFVKGIQHRDDVTRACDAGASGVVISNHGGRQLDRAMSSIESLTRLQDRAVSQTEVLFDSGVRQGTDALVALAHGAKAVFVGRPAIWGLACEGADGVQKILALLAEELRCAMMMVGAADIGEIDRAMVGEDTV